MPPGSPGDTLLTTGICINLALMLFNLIPIPPLDGSKVLSALLPLRHAQAYDRFMGTFGLMLFFAAGLHAASRPTSLGRRLAYFFALLAGYDCMTKKRLLSGMQPTGGGRLHLGNLEGALRPWIKLQDEYEMFCLIADWHALTTVAEKQL